MTTNDVGQDTGPAEAVPVATNDHVDAPTPAAKKKYEPGQLVAEANYDPERLPNGYLFVNGRVTRKQKSARPANIFPEVWQMMTSKQKKDAIEHQAKQDAPADAPAPAPVMPCIGKESKKWRHRQKVGVEYPHAGLAMVARAVKAKEVQTNAAAQAAMRKEWNALREMRAWEEDKVVEWDEVRRTTKAANSRAHVGFVFGI